MSPTRHALSPTRTAARQRPCPPSPAASTPWQQADWTLLEVWSWPASAASEQAAPPQGTPPAAPPGPSLSWPRTRRWPDLDDLGPVEWLQVRAPAQTFRAAQPIKPAR